jgi:hypothetical protein
MKKRIVIVVVGVVVFLLGIFGAWIIMSNMRGPGPDWNIQNAAYRAMAGNADQVAADHFTDFGEKGKTFLWGSSFDEGTGLQEIIPEVAGQNSTVTLDSTLANTGKSSIKLHADLNSGNYAAFYRYGTPGGSIDKFGVLFAAWPQIPASGNDLSHLNIALNANYWGLGRDILIWSGVKIAREAGGTKKLYYYNFSKGLTDTGINVDSIFISRNDASPWQVWHSIKLVINPTVYPPKYDYLEIDGHHFDLSAFTPYYEAPGGANWREGNYISSFISGGTDEGVAKDLNVDDVLLSSNEGLLVSSTLGGGGGSVMHNLLDGSVHPDTLAGSPVAGDLIIANATPLWARFPKGAEGNVLQIVSGLPAWIAPSAGAATEINGAGLFYPQPLEPDNNTMSDLIANRVYITRVIIPTRCKLSDLWNYAVATSPSAHYGGGFWDVAGNVIIKGVTGLIGATANIRVVLTPTFINPGVYLLALTADAGGRLKGFSTYDSTYMALMNTPQITWGYSPTVSVNGVIPDVINPALTGITNQSGPHSRWMLGTINW